MGIMPTGGGKSICYQIPALMLPGVTLVISPLISLMKDQVSALTNAGVNAAFINSSLSAEELRQVYGKARAGEYKLLYVAPERLGAEGFLALMQELEVSLVAVDEAHCISQWGQDFRPSYLRIAGFIACLPRRPVVTAFTATATAQVQEDIVRLLELNAPACYVAGFDRPNLFFDVRRPKNKTSTLLELLNERRGKCGIVYCATRAAVERICQILCSRGIDATRYHAGLSEEERQINQDDFQFDRKSVMVATNAFGMGIDKSNVSFVIHYNMPKSLEAYYQEAGRAGRDGEAADCILLYSAGDVETAKFLIGSNGGDTLRREDYERLNIMVGYCKTDECLRGYILDYFGQEHSDCCGNCGNCKQEYVQRDITIPAQMILSCVLRIKERLGYYVGKTLIVSVLRGSRSQRVQELGLDKLSTYGLMGNLSAAQIRNYIDFIELDGYLRTEPLHSTLEPAGESSDVLFHGKKVFMPVRADRVDETDAVKKRRRRRGSTTAEPEAEDSLFSALKAVRNRIAQGEKVPAYIIFSNATLTDMAAKAPRTMDELLDVSGVGQVKAARYGADFLRAIAEYEEQKSPSRK
jgi:ATP-dependent DNA helicase RecQ